MARLTNIATLGTILGIWAHPDDETWACGGLMVAATANGQKIACIVATKGEAGQTADQGKWPQQQLSRIRETEMGEALSMLGVHDLHWLGYRDGALEAEDSKAAVARLVKLIDRIKPDTILTFEPNGITGHPDHKTISAWARAAARAAACQPVVYGACESQERYMKSGLECDQEFDMYFNTNEPFTVAEKTADLTWKLSRAESRQKLAALKAHHSQTEQFFRSAIGKKFMKQLCETECFIKV